MGFYCLPAFLRKPLLLIAALVFYSSPVLADAGYSIVCEFQITLTDKSIRKGYLEICVDACEGIQCIDSDGFVYMKPSHTVRDLLDAHLSSLYGAQNPVCLSHLIRFYKRIYYPKTLQPTHYEQYAIVQASDTFSIDKEEIGSVKLLSSIENPRNWQGSRIAILPDELAHTVMQSKAHVQKYFPVEKKWNDHGSIWYCFTEEIDSSQLTEIASRFHEDLYFLILERHQNKLRNDQFELDLVAWCRFIAEKIQLRNQALQELYKMKIVPIEIWFVT